MTSLITCYSLQGGKVSLQPSRRLWATPTHSRLSEFPENEAEAPTEGDDDADLDDEDLEGVGGVVDIGTRCALLEDGLGGCLLCWGGCCDAEGVEMASRGGDCGREGGQADSGLCRCFRRDGGRCCSHDGLSLSRRGGADMAGMDDVIAIRWCKMAGISGMDGVIAIDTGDEGMPDRESN